MSVNKATKKAWLWFLVLIVVAAIGVIIAYQLPYNK